MGRFVDIQPALKPLKNRKKLKHIFMKILGLAESLKIKDRPNSIMTIFDDLFFGKYER